MSLEAAARKNPVSHVGKIYNVVARQIAETVIAEIPEIARARCLMVGRIGAPVTCPAIIAINVAAQDGRPVTELHGRIEVIAAGRIARISALIDDFVTGNIELF